MANLSIFWTQRPNAEVTIKASSFCVGVVLLLTHASIHKMNEWMLHNRILYDGLYQGEIGVVKASVK